MSIVLRKVCYALGAGLRGSGSVLNELGASLQGARAQKDELNKNGRIIELGEKQTTIGKNTFLAPNANIVGDTDIADDVTVWYGATLRGDQEKVSIGANSSIGNRSVAIGPALIGQNVNIEQRAIIEKAIIGDFATIESGAKVLEGAKVEERAVVGRGSVVETGAIIRKGEFWAGNPARFVKKLDEAEIAKYQTKVENENKASLKHDQYHSLNLQQREMLKEIADSSIETNGEYYPERMF
eukprot:TRINITY_DN903_c0_g1_i1.p1 TRINITY_DN903_c0_g1~~TRINITY_DN903_c0_g1_i1.p1  ORF type:complete len:240 (-),score=54.79 TRINITY_DN903_c0_g1_i1:27-746(-)